MVNKIKGGFSNTLLGVVDPQFPLPIKRSSSVAVTKCAAMVPSPPLVKPTTGALPKDPPVLSKLNLAINVLSFKKIKWFEINFQSNQPSLTSTSSSFGL